MIYFCIDVSNMQGSKMIAITSVILVLLKHSGIKYVSSRLFLGPYIEDMIYIKQKTRFQMKSKPLVNSLFFF